MLQCDNPASPPLPITIAPTGAKEASMQNRFVRSIRGASSALALSALLVGTAGAGELSGDLGIVSDYVFRGVSQSNQNPALQGGLTYSFENGLYFGTWASQVDFNSDANAEVDLFVGYGFDITENVAADVQVLRYVYPDEGSLNYNEVMFSLTVLEKLSATLAYTDNVYNYDVDGYYVGLGYGITLPGELTLTPTVGYSKFDAGAVSDRSESYLDWALSLSRDFGPVSASLSYHDTNSKGESLFGELAESRVVLGFSVGF